MSDVENALLTELIGITYPNGTTSASILGGLVRLYRGWPVGMSLNADIAAGTTNVSVFSVPGSGRNTTRWGIQTSILPIAPSLTVSVDGTAATFAGAAVVGEIAGILADGVAYVYVIQIGDSPALVAANLCGLISAKRPCLVSGSTVTVPGAIQFVARTASQAAGLQEWSRQEQGFRISVWAPAPALRDQLCSAFCSALAPIAFLTLADGTAGRIRYRNGSSFDDGRDSSTYRRDLIYDVEYPTTTNIVEPMMLFGDLDFNGTQILA
jgi:hypothetical protein